MPRRATLLPLTPRPSVNPNFTGRQRPLNSAPIDFLRRRQSVIIGTARSVRMKVSVLSRRPLAAVGVLACGVMGSGLRPGVVMGNSMSPTLRSGEWFLLDTGAYRDTPPQRGDIVVFRHRSVTYVKRVLGGEKESVRML